MSDSGSRECIEAHELSGELRSLEDSYLEGYLSLEEFRRRVEEEVALFRERLGGRGGATPQARSGIEPESYTTPETDVCRTQTVELDRFRKQLAAELAGIRSAYSQSKPLPPQAEIDAFPAPEKAPEVVPPSQQSVADFPEPEFLLEEDVAQPSATLAGAPSVPPASPSPTPKIDDRPVKTAVDGPAPQAPASLAAAGAASSGASGPMAPVAAQEAEEPLAEMPEFECEPWTTEPEVPAVQPEAAGAASDVTAPAAPAVSAMPAAPVATTTAASAAPAASARPAAQPEISQPQNGVGLPDDLPSGSPGTEDAMPLLELDETFVVLDSESGPEPEPEVEVTMRPARGLDLMWDAEPLPQPVVPSGPSGEKVPVLGRSKGPAPVPKADNGASVAAAIGASGRGPKPRMAAATDSAAEAPRNGASSSPQGIMRALKFADGASPAPPRSVLPGQQRAVPGGNGVPSLRKGPATPPPASRAVPPGAKPAAPRPQGAPNGAAPNGAPVAEKLVNCRPQPVKPAAGAAAKPVAPPRPAKSRVLISGNASWETTDDDIALQMFVPDSQISLVATKGKPEDILGGIGQTEQSEEARKRLATMTRQSFQPQKSPCAAAIISLFMAGAGLLYTGNIALGVILSLIHVTCAAVVFLTQNPLAAGGMAAASILGAVVAYREAQNANAQEMIRREESQGAAFKKTVKESSFSERDLRL